MSGVAGLHGAVAVVLLCGLVFIEEAGVPLPLLPGDGLLIACGVLAANHAVDASDAIPALCVAAVGGALVGYGWARAIGRPGLDALSRRVRAGQLVARAAERLRAEGSGGIIVCRLLPGLRVYTSLVAGASGMEARVFVIGLVPAVVLWVGGFVGIGFAIGVPAERVLRHGEQVALNSVVVVALAAGAYAGLRHIPGREPGGYALARGRRPWRVGFALAVDASIVTALTAGVADLLHDTLGWGDPDGLVDVELVVLVVALAYVAAARRRTGGTARETLFAVSYRPRRGSRSPAGPQP